MRIQWTVFMIILFFGVGAAASVCPQYIENAENALSLSDYSGAASAYEQAAECYADEGKNTQAAQYYVLAAENWVHAGENLPAAADYMQAAQYYRADRPRSCGDEAMQAASLYLAEGDLDNAVSAYITSFECYRDAGSDDDAFEAARQAAATAVQNDEPSTALEYYQLAVEYGVKGNVKEDLCPVYEELGDLIKSTYPSKAAQNYSAAGACYRDYAKDSEKCEQAFQKAIGLTPGSKSAEYYEGAGSCYPKPRATLEMQKCWEHYATAANIYDQVGKYAESGAAYEKAGDCLAYDKTEEGKKVREDSYYKCAKEYITLALSQPDSEAADTILLAKECYDKIKDTTAKQIAGVLAAEALALRSGAESKYNISILAENPRANKNDLLIKKPEQEGAGQGQEQQADNTLLYVGIGVAVLVILLAAFRMIRKKPEEELEMPEEEETGMEEEYQPF